MTRNKHFRSVFAALLCAVLCMTAFATVAYADGGDYYDDELPPETWQEETQPEDNTIVPGTPFTEDGIAATRDLLYDKHTNKQFITVETRNGHTLYIVIDYDKLLDEEEERYQTYFLNPVDEADLMALLEDDSQNTPVVCSCTEKCTAGKVNTNCALCKTDMTNCAGKEATPEETEQPDEPMPENLIAELTKISHDEGFSQIIKTLILHSPVRRDRWHCLRPHHPRILRLRHPRQNRTRPARRRP